MCTYLVSWTYADKLHTLKCIIYFHNVQQHAHKKTSSKTGFTLVCHSFISYYIFLFKKCQTKIFLHFFSFMHYNRHEIKKPSRLLKREITRNSLSSPISRLFFYQTGGHMNTKNKLEDIFCTLPKQLLQLFSASPEMLDSGTQDYFHFLCICRCHNFMRILCFCSAASFSYQSRASGALTCNNVL